MVTILRPHTLLIDTGHLINLGDLISGRGMATVVPSHWGRAYHEISSQMRSGQLTALFYEPLAYEWLRDNSIQRALQISSVLDSAMCVKQVLPDSVLLKVEAMNAAKDIEPTLNYPGFTIVRPIASDQQVASWIRGVTKQESAHPQEVGAITSEANSTPTVSAIVRAMAPVIDGGGEFWKDAIAGSAFALEQTRETQRRLGRKGPCPESFKRHWLRTGVELPELLRIDTPSADPERIVQTLDLGLCPSINLKLDAYWQYARATKAQIPNDIIDLMLLAAIPHADFSLVEKRLADFVRQSKNPEQARRVHRDPVGLVDTL